MVLTYPDYFEEFTCLAGSCPDSCCQEWEVDVDGTAAASYLALSGDLGDALRRVLRQEDGSWRMTIENRRCPMWRADGLCRIQAELGHDALCKTCREFPRLTHEYGPVTERGLELSCPEAARLIFRGPHKLCRQETSGGEEAWDPEALDILLQSRDRILDFLNTTPLPLPQALTVLLLYAHKTQAWLDGENMPEFDPEGYLTFAEGFVQDPELKPRGVEHRQPHSGSFVCIFPYPSRLAQASLRRLRKNPKQNFSLWSAAQFSESRFSARKEKSRREYPLVFSRDFPQYWRKAASENLSGFNSPRLTPIIDFFRGLEILTPRWKILLSTAQLRPWKEKLKYLAIYAVERYWLQAVSDYDLLGRAKFILTACILVNSLEGDPVTNAQLFSKEIENDQDNLDALWDAAYADPAFTDRNLLSILSKI